MTDDNEPTLRETLENAVKEASDKEVAATPNEPLQESEPEDIEPKDVKPKDTKQRDESGKFKKSETKPQTDTPPAVAKTPSPDKPNTAVALATPKVSVPNTWTAAAKAKWGELPPDIQTEIAKRESEVEKGFTKLDEERTAGRTFKDVVMPYMAMIEADGSTPVVAIKSLLNTAYVLRTAPTEQKAALLQSLAKQYGVDLTKVSQSPNPTDPQLLATQERLARLEQERVQERTLREQQEQAATQAQIDTFAADSKNVHFETVKPAMVALLRGGQANDLQEAYDKAVWANPDTRSTLLEAEKQQLQANLVAEKKAKADAARKASGSITGSPGATAPSNPSTSSRSLREDLEAAMAEARG